jgi:uncharacterized protein YjbI with pentapeptide repeats
LYIILSVYVAWQTLKGDPKFFVVRTFALAFAAWGGTNFYQADLTEANFSKARLKNTNFAQATLSRTCFKASEKLNRARPGLSLLQNWDVLNLLVTGQGHNKNFSNANLRGANLAGADLSEANLSRADLSEATLVDANLKDANLKEAACVGTQFRGAYLTGACLEAWNIDSTTQLEAVDCQYVFLLEKPNQLGDRERRPHDPRKMFRPGDFEKYFKEFLDELKILIADGINPEAFRAAFQKLRENHNIELEDIRSIEKQGNDVILKVQVPPNTDKAQAEQDFDLAYKLQLKAERAEALLESERQHNQQIVDLVKHITAPNPEKLNISISAGGDINTSGILNLGEITGNVTNTLTQLQQANTPHATELATLLKDLQTAIQTDSHLSDPDKAEALAQVQILAEAGQNPTSAPAQQTAKRATRLLKGLAAELPTVATIAQSLETIVPAIAKIFGF